MRVSVHSGPITEELIASHTVVVATTLPRAEALRWNSFCRAQSPPVGYVQSTVHGAMGYAFVDFGPGFMVSELRSVLWAVGSAAAFEREHNMKREMCG